MLNRRLFAVLVSLVALPLGAAMRSPQEIVNAFAEALPAATPLPMLSFSVSLDDIDEWQDLNRVFDSYACITVRGHRESFIRIGENKIIANVDLDATAESWPDVTVSLPAHWTLIIEQTDKGWLLTGAMKREKWIGRRLFEAGDDAQRQCILDESGLDAAAILRSAADACRYRYRLGGANETLAFGTRWAREHDDAITETRCLDAMFDILFDSDESVAALSYAEAAHELAARRAPRLLSAALFKLGLGQWTTGHIDEALTSFQQSASLIDSAEERLTAVRALYMAGYLYEQRGEYRRTIQVVQQVFQLASRLGYRRLAIDSMWLLGDVQFALRNVEAARNLHRQVLESSAALGLVANTGFVMSDLARDEFSLGNFSFARDLLARALGLQHVPNKYVLGDWLALLTLGGQYEEAEEFLRHCPCDNSGFIADPAANSQVHLARSGVLFFHARYGEAEAEVREALRLAVTPGGTMQSSPWPAELMLGYILEKRGRVEEARQAYRDAINVVEYDIDRLPSDDIGRLRYFGDKTEPYRALAALLAGQRDIVGALSVTEAVRGHELRQILEQGKVDIAASLSADERKERDELEKRVVALNVAYLHAEKSKAVEMRKAVEQGRTELEDLEARLALEHGAVRTASALRGSDILGFAKTLKPGQLIVDYLLGTTTSYAFLVSKRGDTPHFEMRRLAISRKDADRLANEFSTALAQRDADYKKSSRALYDAVIAPLASAIAPYHDVVIVPDGLLWRVPFEALADVRGIPLIRRASVSYAPSLLVLRESRKAHSSHERRALLALGNPVVGTSAQQAVRAIERDANLGALPEAASEVKKLGSLYQRMKSDVYVGAAATESLFKREAASHRILHLAVHGFVEDRSPLFSCLLLAPDAHEDGLLEMREIIKLKLDADLVVLSACDSARGSIAPGEGVIGLSWAFLAAGCPSAVVSQWKVDSAATERLMIEFHRRLIQNGLHDKSASLRQAKIALLDDPRYGHPFYWAPFVLFGAGD